MEYGANLPMVDDPRRQNSMMRIEAIIQPSRFDSVKAVSYTQLTLPTI